MKKVIIGIAYSIFSVFWLFFSILFTSALWLEKPGTKEWAEDSMFIPMGIAMLIIWAISLIAIIFRLRKSTDADSDIS